MGYIRYTCKIIVGHGRVSKHQVLYVRQKEEFSGEITVIDVIPFMVLFIKEHISY